MSNEPETRDLTFQVQLEESFDKANDTLSYVAEHQVHSRLTFKFHVGPVPSDTFYLDLNKQIHWALAAVIREQTHQAIDDFADLEQYLPAEGLEVDCRLVLVNGAVSEQVGIFVVDPENGSYVALETFTSAVLHLLKSGLKVPKVLHESIYLE